MNYTISLSRRAEKEVLDLPPRTFSRIQEAIDRLGETPRPVGVRKLQGRDTDWRIRVGQFRILFSIDDSRHHIIIHRVTNRKDVYRL